MNGSPLRYEKSFIEVMQGLNEELLQLSVGELPQDRNKKKVSKLKLEK